MTPTKTSGTDPKPPPRKRGPRPSTGVAKLADVARAAGVSTATASRALNSPRLVSVETRERVQRAIKDLNWIPHGAAKALASLKSHTIGALIPTLGHQSIAIMLESLQQELGKAGYTLLLGRPDDDDALTVSQASKMLESGVEAMILFGEDQPRELLELFERRDVFYVVAYTSGRGKLKNCIGINHFAEMEKLTRYLLDLGHRDIGMITRPYRRNDRIRDRVESVRETLARQGIAIRPQHVYVVPETDATSGSGVGAGRAGLRQILNESPRITAVVCINDYLAAGALIEARAAGFSVPEDLSIVGFDDVEMASQLDPPLTTIHVPSREIGTEVGRFIVRWLAGDRELPPTRIEAKLMVRGTAGSAPQSSSEG